MAAATESSRFERPLLLLGLAAAAAVISTAGAWSLELAGPWFGAWERAFVLGLLAAAGLVAYGVATRRVGVRVWTAALLSLVPVGHALAELTGHALSYSVWESQRIAALAIAVCGVGAVGLVLRKSWARWLALAAALAGLGTSSLNIVHTLEHPSTLTWIHALAIAFSAIVGLALVGPSVRAQFEAEGADGVWSSSDPAVRGVRWTVLAQLVAIPMLLVYAWIQPIVPQTQTSALVLAAVLGAGALACMARKLAGALLLCVGGPALLVQAAATSWLVRGDPGLLSISGYYACFWVPAGVISTLAGIALARPVLRLWRELGEG